MGNQILGMTLFTPSNSASASKSEVHEHNQRPSSPQEMFPGFNISGEHSHEKPCRACTDFKTWAKFQKQRKDKETGDRDTLNSTNLGATGSGSSADNEEGVDADLEALLAERARMQCPLDKDELGKSTWSLLHTMAAYFPENPTPVQQKEMSAFVKIFAKYYPCEHCAQDFQKSIKTSPPETSGREQFSVWLCRMHNEVNRKLGKPEFDCRKIDERWKEGWDDGSCDV